VAVSVMCSCNIAGATGREYELPHHNQGCVKQHCCCMLSCSVLALTAYKTSLSKNMNPRKAHQICTACKVFKLMHTMVRERSQPGVPCCHCAEQQLLQYSCHNGSDANRMTHHASQSASQARVLQSWRLASPFDYRAYLALLLRLGRGAPPAEGRGGLGPLSAGASPAAAASLSALPSQYSLHSCCGSSASMASVNCTDTSLRSESIGRGEHL